MPNTPCPKSIDKTKKEPISKLICPHAKKKPEEPLQCPPDPCNAAPSKPRKAKKSENPDDEECLAKKPICDFSDKFKDTKHNPAKCSTSLEEVVERVVCKPYKPQCPRVDDNNDELK